MARKLAVLVLGLMVIAMSLLAIRQREVEVAREAARAHWRLNEQRRSLATLQQRLAEVTHPDRIRERLHGTPEVASRDGGRSWGR